MRRKAHGVRFSLRGERRSLLGKTKLGGRQTQLARRMAKLARGRAKSRSERQSLLWERRNSRGDGLSSLGENSGSRGERKNLLGGNPSSLGERRSLRGEWQNSRAAGKAPPFEFLPLLSTCPLGGHATPWFTAPWISAPLASLFLDFFHPLNSCHLLVLHSFTPAYWVSDYPFFDSRHLRFLKAVCASFPIPPPHSTFVFPLCPATKKTAKISIFLPCKIEKF